MTSAPELVSALADQLKERTRQARWYRRNACARHGVHFDDDPSPSELTVRHQHRHQHSGIEQTQASEPASVTDAGSSDRPIDPESPASASLPPATRGLPKWLLPAIAGAGMTLPWAMVGGKLLSRPEAAPAPVVQQSLLQDLEDRGFHLPPEDPP